MSFELKHGSRSKKPSRCTSSIILLTSTWWKMNVPFLGSSSAVLLILELEMAPSLLIYKGKLFLINKDFSNSHIFKLFGAFWQLVSIHNELWWSVILELCSFTNLNHHYVINVLRFLLFLFIKKWIIKTQKCDVILKSWYINKSSGNLLFFSVLKIVGRRIKHTNMVQVPINWNAPLTLQPKFPPQQ